MTRSEIEVSREVGEQDREELVRRRLAGKRGGARAGIQRADRGGWLPLSFGQQQMWFLNRLEPGSPEYLVPVALRLRGPLDEGALRRSWQRILARHEILRTRYVLVGEQPRQVIDEPRDVDLTVVDLTGLPGEQRESGAREHTEREARTGFDLEQEWPARASLVRLDDDHHVFVMTFHHIACDAWSIGVLGKELGAFYRAELAGETVELPALPVQYADYAAWERSRSEAHRRHLDYWRRELADLEPLELPTDRPRPNARSWQGDVVLTEFADELSDRLRALALRHNATLFMVLLTAFQTLLARYTGRTDIPVGTMVSGRTRPELQQLIGYGINSLVLRTRCEGGNSFASVLARTRRAVQEAFDHQDVPFARLVDEIQPERDMSRTPLFQTAFTLHEAQAEAFELSGLRVAAMETTSKVSRFDLTVLVQESEDGSLRAQFEYVTALFDRSTVERMARHYLRLLEDLVTEPDKPVGTLEILDDDERPLVQGAAAQEADVASCVHEVFEDQVADMPDAIALSCQGVALTYAELNERANRLAHHLRALGAGPESLVGVCLERGVDLVPTLLGVLKAGAAYLPLDPAQPDDRLAFMLDDAGASVVVTRSDQLDRLSGIHSGHLVVLDRDAEQLAARPATNPGHDALPDNSIYVIYTSGSTGRPKGVCMTHRNVLRLMLTADRHYEFGPTDVWPLFHSYAFDVSVWELWGALLYGGRLVVLPQAVTRSPDDLLDVLVEEQVTVLNQTPSAFRGLVALAAQNDPRLDRLALRAVVFAGEKLEIGELHPWVDRFGVRQPTLINMYGITETTVHSTYHEVTAADLAPAAGNPIGCPLADLRIYLLDEDGNLAPIGVTGEIHVGGPGLARGYLNRPELTAQRFVPDPFGAPGSRLYRSGDLARRRLDGSLEFLGRIDDQVKIRGYRIELGEIEATLTGHPEVRDATVVLREDVPGDKQLVGYLVPAGDEAPAASELRALLARALPEYMVPAAFVPLSRLPLTNNGKLDRRALPAPDRSTLGAEHDYVAPRTSVEEQLAGIWGEVLRVDRVGVHDGFFDLGGDSIRAVALVGALRSAGFDLAVRDVFEHRTIAELAELLADRTGPAEPERTVAPFGLISDEDRAALPDGVVDAYPLSRVQAGMVVEMLSDTTTRAYHNVTSFRIRDEVPFSFPALQEAARIVVARHEVLRTSIDLTSFSVPMQLVHGSAEMPVQTSDLRNLEADEVDTALHEFTARERDRLFDLATPSLVRLHAHVCDGDTWWMSITECHAVIEGWSHHTLLMEVLDCYRAIRDGAEPEPVELPELRYADFIAAELRALESESDRQYWRDVVSGRVPFELPDGWGTGADAPGESMTIPIAFHDLESGLRSLASKAGASMKSVLLAAHLKVLSQLTHEPSFYSGLVLHGRPEVLGAERVYGMYLNSLPFAFDGCPASWCGLVEDVYAQETAMWPHRRFPMPAIQQEMGEGERLLNVRFSYHDFAMVDRERVDYTASIDDSPTEFPLAVVVRLGYVCLVAHSRALTRSHAERLGAMYRAVLEAMAADPDGDAQATCLPSGERQPALGSPEADAVSSTVCEQFEAQAAKTPYALAVTFGDTELKYAELDDRSNRLAHRLRERGVGPESVVGVLLDRGPELLTALLAVWKAGGAYLPMDPSYPADRLEYMLTDSGARLVVTESRYADRFPEDVAERVDTDAIDSLPSAAIEVPADLDRLAYVIYTSGSTGRPKGVAVTHRGLANHVQWAASELAARGTGGAPLFSSVAFDLVVPNLYAPLVSGQRVCLLPQDIDMADIGRALAEAGPFSFIKLTLGHLDVLAHQLTAEEASGLAQVMVVAGEPFTRRTLERWRELDPQTELINEYGPTEASVGTSVFPVAGAPEADVLPIGAPLPNMTMHVLDRWLQPVPSGVIGELHVGGTGVARGYVNQPGRTAQQFLPDPFGHPGSRLYRTGDLVRRLECGNVEFLGRIDDQVKIRGYRVELGEIQAVLVDHPAVRDAVVLAHETSRGETLLVGYVVTDGPLPSPEDLHRHCGARLPEYMIPSTYLGLDRIPLTANGKVDRRALPEPVASPTSQPTAPRTPVEERIFEIWKQILGHDDFGVRESFYAIGGHSIHAVAMVGALRSAGFDVAVADVFEHRTIAELAEALSGQQPGSWQRSLVAPFDLIGADDEAKLAADVVDAYPMSQVQIGMVLEMFGDASRNKYHNTTSFRINDDRPFSLPALCEAARIVARRHEMLRTSFDLDRFSVPMQLVHDTAEIPVQLHDLRSFDKQRFDATLQEFTAGERAALFDLSVAPLMRIAVQLETDQAWWLSVTVCHAITEGWSHRLLLTELLDYYRQLRDGQQPEPAPIPDVRYADFIDAELRALRSESDWEYWRKIITNYSRFELPSRWAEPPGTPQESYLLPVAFDDLREGLQTLADAAGASLKSVLLAAHLKVLSQLTNDRAFFTGLVCSARPEEPGAEQVCGMYINTLPFPYDRNAATWRELVRRVFAGESECWRHRQLPMPAIQREAGVPRLLDVMFSYRDFDAAETNLVDGEIGMGEGAGDGANEFPLAVSTMPGHLVLTADNQALSRSNADRVAEMYRAVLCAMAADPDSDAQASYLPETEQDRMAQWNDTAVEW